MKEPKKKSSFGNRILYCCMALVLILTLSGCSTDQKEALSIVSEPVEIGSIAETMRLIGNVEPAQYSELSWKTSGVIESVEVSPGDQVEAGQTLATLSEESMSADSLTAEVSMIEAEDALEELLNSKTAKAQAYKDLRDAEMARQDAELFTEGLNYPVASQSEIDAAEKLMIGARDAYQIALDDFEGVKLRDEIDEERTKKYATLQSALTEYASAYDLWLYYVDNTSDMTKSVAKASSNEAEEVYQSALKEFKTYQESFVRAVDQANAEVALDNAVTNYNKRSLIAGISGEVTQMSLAVGDYVIRGSYGIRIDDLDELHISLNVSEIDVNRLQDGQAAEIVLDAQPDKTYEGVVRYISSYATNNSYNVTYKAVVAFEHPDDDVKVGMTGEIKIVLAEKENCLLVPSAAVQSDSQGTFVEVVEDGDQIKTVYVTTGLEDNGMIELLSDNVQAGDQVRIR